MGLNLSKCHSIDDVKAIIDEWVDYCNTERYRWQLNKLSQNEYYEYLQTGGIRCRSFQFF